MQRFIILGLATLFFSLTGCASVKMHDTDPVKEPGENKVIVNFVRPAVFFGDGLSADIWDSEKYVGSLGASTIIQYETEPGKHIFLSSAENWSYAAGDLIAGKQYFLKVNIVPGFVTGRTILGVADISDDRVAEWRSSLRYVSATEEDKSRIETEKADSIKDAVDNFNNGGVSSYEEIGLNNAFEF